MKKDQIAMVDNELSYVNHILSFTESHTTSFADGTTHDLAGNSEMDLDSSLDILHKSLSDQLPQAMAFALTAGLACIVPERISP
jgi:hypothetical protein